MDSTDAPNMILPLRDVIVIDPMPPPEMIGGIIVPLLGNTANQAHHFAMVVYAGPKSDARPGAKIYCSELFGTPIEHEGRKLRIGRARDIAGIVEEVAFHAPPLVVQ